VLDKPPGTPGDGMGGAAVQARYWQGGGLFGCRVRLCGTHGIHLGSGCRGVRIAGCALEDLGGNGAIVGLLRDAATDAEAVTDCAVADCTVRRAGRIRLGSVGIWIGFATGCRVVHNEVAELPYTGISVGWRWDPSPAKCGKHEVSHNHIHDVMRLVCDGAGIYCLGRQAGSRMEGNRVHDVRRAKDAHSSPIAGIYFDQGSQGWTVTGNAVHGIDDRAFNLHKPGQYPDNKAAEQPDPLVIADNIIEAATDGALGQRNPPYDRMTLLRKAGDATDALVKWGANTAVARGKWSAEMVPPAAREAGPRARRGE
jgi:hypothetical protein